MGLSRRTHEKLQELITWGGSAVTLVAMYYLFIAPAKIEAGAPRRIPVKDFLDIKEGATIPGLYPPPPAAGGAGDGAGGQLR